MLKKKTEKEKRDWRRGYHGGAVWNDVDPTYDDVFACYSILLFLFFVVHLLDILNSLLSLSLLRALAINYL